MSHEEEKAENRPVESDARKKGGAANALPAWSGGRLVLGMALIALSLGLLSGLGHRWQWWSFRTGFLVLKWAAYGAIVILLLSAIGMYRARPGRGRPGFGRNLLAFLLSGVLAGIPALGLYRAKQVPRIHDISTDTGNPPLFVTLLPLRLETPNGAAYGGLDVAIQQQKAYPEIDTLLMTDAPAATFDKALSTAKTLRWEIVAADAEALRIEATDTTFWFGFKDDIVIRIRPMDTGSRLDIRSMSRVGLSDVGANAARIRRYIDLIRKK